MVEIDARRERADRQAAETHGVGGLELLDGVPTALDRHRRQRQYTLGIVELQERLLVDEPAPGGGLIRRQRVAEDVGPNARDVQVDALPIEPFERGLDIPQLRLYRPRGWDIRENEREFLSAQIAQRDVRECLGGPLQATDDGVGGEVRMRVDDRSSRHRKLS